MRMPLGRVHNSVTVPTGSLSARTTSMPSAIASTRSASSESRSRKAPVTPAARASATSSALAARIAAVCARTAAAISCKARFFCSVGASARIRAAARARRPISSMAAAISPEPSMLLSGAVIFGGELLKTLTNPCPSALSYHVGASPGEIGPDCAACRGLGDPGDNVDNGAANATHQLTYTLVRQGGDVAGGGHGVQFRPSSQSFSGRHQIRDRGKTGPGRSGAGVQPLSGVPGRDVLPAAGPARQTQIGAGRTTGPAIAFARPLTQRSARDLRRLARSWVGSLAGRTGRPASWRMAVSANGPVRPSIEDPETQKPQPPVGWG